MFDVATKMRVGELHYCGIVCELSVKENDIEVIYLCHAIDIGI